MEKISWFPSLAVGIPELDEAHRALLAAFAQLANASDSQFGASFDAVVATMELDFRNEESLMESLDYTAQREHRAEHARVLGALHHISAELERGDLTAGRKAAALLPRWFLAHLTSMDAALAAARSPAITKN